MDNGDLKVENYHAQVELFFISNIHWYLLLEVVLALGADDDAEQGEAVLRVADLGDAAVRVGLQIWAVDGEAGDARRGSRPEGDQDALALLLGPAPAAIGSGGVGAVAEVAERVDEDGLRKRRVRILGVDGRRDREQPEFVVIHAHGNRGGRCGGGGRRRNGSGTLTQGGEMNLWMGSLAHTERVDIYLGDSDAQRRQRLGRPDSVALGTVAISSLLHHSLSKKKTHCCIILKNKKLIVAFSKKGQL